VLPGDEAAKAVRQLEFQAGRLRVPEVVQQVKSAPLTPDSGTKLLDGRPVLDLDTQEPTFF
jgi:hypothetical protein